MDSKRARRNQIPEGLWEAAINLSKVKDYSINKISKALRLNYSDLKRRISAHGKPIITDLDLLELGKSFWNKQP